MHHDRHTPVLIVGGGTGGVAAALAFADAGQRCILVEPTDWLGGQLTAQAVPPDENRWIEPGGYAQGGTARYLAFRQAIRDWYRAHRNLTPQAAADPRLNPGGGWVSRLCYEPVVGRAVIDALLAPHIQAGRVATLLHHRPVEADIVGDRIRAITFTNDRTADRVTLAADLFLDATEAGELLPIVGAEHRVGSDSHADFGELHAPPGPADPLDQQAITWVFAIEHRPGERHTLDKPDGYDAWASFVPQLTPPWPGPLFSWTICGEALAPRDLAMTPWPDDPADGTLELWRYRRVVDRAIHAGDTPPADVSLVNWVQNDYFRKPTLIDNHLERDAAYAEAKQQSRCLLYWMQTAAPRHDGGTGYPGLRLCPQVMGTDDGFAAAPYIREPRRLDALTVITEAHVGADQRRSAGHPDLPEPATPAAEPFADSVGIGHYPIDLHPSASGRNQVYVDACPFRLPLSALVPKRLTNLLAAGKALGVSHIANGCTRLHPVEWNVGESAGTAAAACLDAGIAPHALAADPARVADLQRKLTAAGVPLSWPWER
ncbi:MAG: FAD-dependent oxidoreductase [Planctomycetota bacterium]